MTDTKYKDVQDFSTGYDVTHKTTLTKIISLSDKLVARDGSLVSPFAAINDKTPTDVIHSQRYWLVERVTDGWSYEELFDQQVQAGAGEPQLSTRAIRQGADNDEIEYSVATLTKPGGTDTVTYESGRVLLTGFKVKVSNRKGTIYQPVTVRFKVRGNRT